MWSGDQILYDRTRLFGYKGRYSGVPLLSGQTIHGLYGSYMPLKFTTKFRPDGGRLGRWAFLQNYSYKTEYKTGKTDTLSRIPFPEVVHDNLTQHPAVALCSVDPSDCNNSAQK